MQVDVGSFNANGRARRPPPDILNALLSFTYALLTKDLTVAPAQIGLDPAGVSCIVPDSVAKPWHSTWPKSSARWLPRALFFRC